MDFKRIALFAALAVVSYLLLLQWQQDYPPGSSSPASDPDQTLTGTELPVVTSDANDGLPDVETPVTPAADTPVEASPTGELISVVTPVQHVRIDPVGGDIVYIALPTYPRSIDAENDPFVLLHRDSNGTFIAQSALRGPDGIDNEGRATFRAEQTRYELDDENGSLSVPLSYTDDAGVRYTKTFTFSGNDFLIDVSYSIDNTAEEAWQGNLVGVIRRDSEDDPSVLGRIGKSYLGAAITTDNDRYRKIDFGDMEDRTTDTVNGGWIAFSQHYFLSGWIPAGDEVHTYETRQAGNGDYLMSFRNDEPTVIPAGSTGTVSASFWAGPKDQHRLDQISPNLGYTIDYGKLYFVAKPIFELLTWLNTYIGNYGWSIIAMTLVIKGLLIYFSTISYRSMAKMRKLTPHVNALKERHGEDKQKLMQAQMELWRREKVNPMGGCLPMLLQMPVLLGIYWVLSESVELRQSPWILWYQDLSAMDPYFILPLVMGATMYISQLMTPMTTMDPMQAKMLRLMPVFFTVFFLWFPSGLVLYWLVSNVFNILHQAYINRQVDKTFNPKHA